MEVNSGIGLISAISNMPIVGGNLKSFIICIIRLRGYIWGLSNLKFNYKNRNLLVQDNTFIVPILFSYLYYF